MLLCCVQLQGPLIRVYTYVSLKTTRHLFDIPQNANDVSMMCYDEAIQLIDTLQAKMKVEEDALKAQQNEANEALKQQKERENMKIENGRARKAR